MTLADLEKRIASLESQVAALRAQKPGRPRLSPIETLESIHNTFPDDEAFREAMRLGRQWRKSLDRPRRRRRRITRK